MCRGRNALSAAGLFLFVLASGSPAWGQAFGTGSQLTVIPAAAFVPETSSMQYSSVFGVALKPTVAADTRFVAPLGLPNGAVIEDVRLFVVDDDPTLDISGYLLFYGHPFSGTSLTCGPAYFATSSTAGLTGGGLLTLTPPGASIRATERCGTPPVDAYVQEYVEAILRSAKHSLSGAVVKWHRRLSPAPSVSTFGDVPTSDPFFRAIEAFAGAGLTSGCGSGNFCPDEVVTRKQLAKFLATALGLHWPD